MAYPAEFFDRVFKTRFSGFSSSWESLDQIQNLAEGSEIDVIYENGKPIVVVVFETPEDCTAFTLKYGDKYAYSSI